MTETARLLTFDLETLYTTDPVQTQRIREEAIDKAPAKSAAKAIKLAWDTEEARQARADEAIAKTAVDPELAEIVTIGIALDDADPASWQPDGITYDEDARGFEFLMEMLDQMTSEETIWIGHNIAGFDLPILLNTCRRLNVTPPRHFPTFRRGRWLGRVYDTMERFPGKTPFTSLDAACAAYRLPPVEPVRRMGTPMDGSRVADAWYAHERGLVGEYCRKDVAQVRALYLRMTAGDSWGTWPQQDEVAEQLRQIDNGGASDTAKRLAKYTVLENAGLVPAH